MKNHKTITKTLISALAGFSSFFLLSSCDGVIFDTIRDEVKLADAEITGDIQNIVRYTLDGKEHVFVSTGEISYRSIDGTLADTKMSFADFPTRPSGFVYSLAADSSNLYALSVTIEKDDDGYNVGKERNLYCYDGSEWKNIWSKSYDGSTAAILMSTNTPKVANRKAYFRCGTDIWDLTGSTELTDENKRTDAVQESDIATGKTFSDYDNKTVPTYLTRSCSYFNGSVYFSSAYAMATNETPESDATFIYYSSSDYVYYSSDASSWTSVNLNCDVIYSMALTSDYLLAGTDSGIVHTPLKENVPSAGNSDFDTNAASTLSSYYEVPSILVLDSSQKETTATIFASAVTSSTSASLGNVGLWSYFATDGKWNRE